MENVWETIRTILGYQLDGWYWLPVYVLVLWLANFLEARFQKWEPIWTIDNKLDMKEKGYLYLLWQYPGSGLIQHLVLVLLVYLPLTFVVDAIIALTISSVVFGMSHFGRPFLRFATPGMATILLCHFHYYNNILFMGIAHGLIAAQTYYTLPKYTDLKNWSPFKRTKEVG